MSGTLECNTALTLGGGGAAGVPAYSLVKAVDPFSRTKNHESDGHHPDLLTMILDWSQWP